MDTGQHQRAVIRRQGCLLNGTRVVFFLALFVVFIIGIGLLHSALLSLIPASIFLFAGGILLSRMIAHQQQRKWQWLQQYGTAIQVPVTSIEKREKSVGSSQPLNAIWRVSYSLKLDWRSPDGRTYTFKQQLATSASTDNRYAPGTLLTVYIDPADPTFYRVML
jgi:hypothetical protein